MRRLWLPLLLVGAVPLLLAVFLWSRAADPPRPAGPAGDETRMTSFDEAPSPEAAPSGPVATTRPADEALSSEPDAADAAPTEDEEPVSEAGPAVGLERLLTWQDEPAPKKGLDLGIGAQPPATAGGNDPGLRDRVYLERHSEDAQPTDQERTRKQTDVGVKVPVGSAARVRGGVRVESAEGSESPVKDVERTPTVGVEIDF